MKLQDGINEFSKKMQFICDSHTRDLAGSEEKLLQQQRTDRTVAFVNEFDEKSTHWAGHFLLLLDIDDRAELQRVIISLGGDMRKKTYDIIQMA